MAAAAIFGGAAKQLLNTGRGPWMLLALACTSAAVALAGFARWKCVRRGAQHYLVSDLIRSECISRDDVCLVVQARGLVGNRVHVHFRRPTRFGWSISYVPARPRLSRE